MIGSATHAGKVLITGGAGFIGSHVADRFIEAGYEVAVLDNLSTGKKGNLPAGVEFHRFDVESAEAAALVSEGGFGVIAHLAAQMDVRKSVEDPLFDLRTNVVGTVNLMEAVRSLPASGRPRVVFASTGGALYGEAARFPTPENVAVNPDAPYGIDKLSAELYLAYYSRIWGIESVVLRFGNVYGPRQDPLGEAGVIAIFANRLAANQPLTVYGTGNQTRDYIYVSDVARAFFLAATQPAPAGRTVADRAFNIGTALETSVNELIETLSAVAGIRPAVEHVAPRPGEVERSVLDPQKAREQLGWQADVELRQGLADTYNWLTTGSRPVRVPREASAL